MKWTLETVEPEENPLSNTPRTAIGNNNITPAAKIIETNAPKVNNLLLYKYGFNKDKDVLFKLLD